MTDSDKEEEVKQKLTTLTKESGVEGADRLADALGERAVGVFAGVTRQVPESVVQAALAGLGVILQPGFLVGPLIARGELVRVLPDWEGNTGHFWALLPSRMMPATVRHHHSERSPRRIGGNHRPVWLGFSG